MMWQQKLGQFSPTLKSFANHWEIMAWVNLLLIWIINLLLIWYLVPKPEVDSSEFGSVYLRAKIQKVTVDTFGYLQLICAFLVMIAYYI